MFSKKVVLREGEARFLCARETAGIKVWVNNVREIYLPIVHEGSFTIDLTDAGLMALEAIAHNENSPDEYVVIDKVEFVGDDKAYADALHALKMDAIKETRNVIKEARNTIKEAFGEFLEFHNKIRNESISSSNMASNNKGKRKKIQQPILN
jgi:hypothetical protein